MTNRERGEMLSRMIAFLLILWQDYDMGTGKNREEHVKWTDVKEEVRYETIGHWGCGSRNESCREA